MPALSRRGTVPGPVVGRDRDGFTLIELVVVLTLIAILSAAILPEMRGSMEETVLRATARDLVAACQAANARAVASGQAQQLILDTGAHRYRIEALREPSERGQAAAGPDAGEKGRLDARITVEVVRADGASAGAPMRLEFQPDGTSSAGDILLRDRSGFRLKIHLNPITARPSVREAGGTR